MHLYQTPRIRVQAGFMFLVLFLQHMPEPFRQSVCLWQYLTELVRVYFMRHKGPSPQLLLQCRYRSLQVVLLVHHLLDLLLERTKGLLGWRIGMHQQLTQLLTVVSQLLQVLLEGIEIRQRFKHQIFQRPQSHTKTFLSHDYYNHTAQMGCIDSSTYHPAVHTFLSQQIKEIYRGIIAEDNLGELMDLEKETKYPSNIQLSEPGLLWTTVHFCCRFDAPNCIDYFLKKTYISSVKEYLTLVNHQTAQGQSCLHLCAAWGSLRCFALLVRYGGLNLDLIDQVGKNPIDVAMDYNRSEMRQVLHVLKRRYGTVTSWHYKFLQQIHNVKQMQEEQFYDDILNKVLSDTETSKEVETEESQEAQNLRIVKHKLIIEILEIRNQASQDERSLGQAKRRQAKKENKKDLSDGEESIGEDERQNILENLTQLNHQIEQKQQELEKIKSVMKKVMAISAFRQLARQERKALERSQNQETAAQVFDSFQQFTQKVINNKTEISMDIKSAFQKRSGNGSFYRPVRTGTKSIMASDKTDWLASKDKKHFDMLPQSIKDLYQESRLRGKFIDPEFPHSPSSIGTVIIDPKIINLLHTLVWMRPKQFLGDDFQLFDGIAPNDVKQGQLGVCYCLATIAQLARQPARILSIFVFYDLDIGFYVLKFHKNAKPSYMVVDDYFPCNPSSLQPLFSKPIGNEIWVLLIEKAWSKMVGSYFAAEKMTPDYFMEELLGAPTLGIWFKDKTEKTKEIIGFSKMNYPIVLSTGSKQIDGIVKNHAYSLLKVFEHQGSYIYKVRNPWGYFQWQGCYGDDSPLWTPQLAKRCQAQVSQDGIFFVSESQLLYAFEYYSVAMMERRCRYNYVEFESEPDQNIFFTFRLQKSAKLALKITQMFHRWVDDKNYQYSSAAFETGRIEGDKVKFLSQGNNKCYFGGKSVYADSQIFKQYQAGQYFIRVKMQWKHPKKYNKAVLSVYCEQNVSVERIENQKGEDLWKKLLYDFITNKPTKKLNENIEFGMHWMRGQMIALTRLLPDSPSQQLDVTWTYNKPDLQNCQLAMNKDPDDFGLKMRVTREHPQAFGTLNRLVLSKKCRSGTVSVKTHKL